MTSDKTIEGINIIYHTLKHAGGMERYVLDLIKGFSKKGIKVGAIARKIDESLVFDASVELIQIKDLTPSSKLNKLLFDFRSSKRANNNWPVLSCTRTPAPVDIAIVGGTHIGHNKAIDKKKLGLFDKLTNKRELVFFNNAKTIVAHSKMVGDEVIDLYNIEASKLKVIYPPVDFSSFSLDSKAHSEKIRHDLGVSKDKILLIFPSNNHFRKGLALILNALEQSDSRYILAIASRKPVDHPKAINLGFRKDMNALYAACDAAILASKYEPFGLVGAESILCGTPVILSEAVGATEVIKSNACLKFDLNIESLIETLAQFAQLHDSKQINIDKPRELIPEIKNIANHCDDLINVITR